jgi:hypothetical protein
MINSEVEKDHQQTAQALGSGPDSRAAQRAWVGVERRAGEAPGAPGVSPRRTAPPPGGSPRSRRPEHLHEKGDVGNGCP